MRRFSFLIGMLAVTYALGAQAAPVELPADPRLAEVRPRLEQMVKKASADGLPAELIVGKVREGLAKGVDPARIESAAGRLYESLGRARAFVVERRPAGPPARDLVRAVAEAEIAGVELAAADPVVRGGRAADETARAVEVLTDLTLRGYPTGRAAGVVKEVLARDPGALGRVPSTLETVRTEQALTHGEAAEALAHGLRGGGSLSTAAGRAGEPRGRDGAGRGGPGKGAAEGFVPPGQLKKQNGASEARGRKNDNGNPGKGKGPGKK